MYIYKSLKFRYNHYRQSKKAKAIEEAKNKHAQKMEQIKVSEKFTIISSNCWGGSVYEDLNLPYQTPTIGLFLYASCFLELLADLRNNLELPLTFVKDSKYDRSDVIKVHGNKYPIGNLGDNIEIHFLHYATEEEALIKWDRRKKRINWDSLYISCTDRDGMTPLLMREYDKLPYENKVLFTGTKNKTIQSSVFLRAYRKQKVVGDLYNQRYHVTSDFDLKEWIE